MEKNDRIKKIADELVERRIRESKCRTIDELEIFSVVTLEELAKMHKDKKISFLFKSSNLLLKKYGSKSSITKEALLTTLHGTFLIATIIFIIYYSISRSQYIVLVGLPIFFVALALTSPYQKFSKPATLLSVIMLIGAFFAENPSLKILLLIFSLTNIITTLSRRLSSKIYTSLILSNEEAFVQGYLRNIFTLRNNRNKKIMQNVGPPAMQERMLWEFEEGLTV